MTDNLHTDKITGDYQTELYKQITGLEVHILDTKTKQPLHSFELTVEAMIAMVAFNQQYCTGDQDGINSFLGDSDRERQIWEILSNLHCASHACILNKSSHCQYSIEEPDGNTHWPLYAGTDDEAKRLFREFACLRRRWGWWSLHKKGERKSIDRFPLDLITHNDLLKRHNKKARLL